MSDEQPKVPPAEQPSEPQSTTRPVTTENQRANESSYGVQMFLGVVSSWLFLPGIVWLWFVLRIIDKVPSPALHVSFSLLLAGLGVSIWVWRHKRGRGLAVGFLIGLALFVLSVAALVSTMK